MGAEVSKLPVRVSCSQPDVTGPAPVRSDCKGFSTIEPQFLWLEGVENCAFLKSMEDVFMKSHNISFESKPFILESVKSLLLKSFVLSKYYRPRESQPRPWRWKERACWSSAEAARGMWSLHVKRRFIWRLLSSVQWFHVVTGVFCCCPTRRRLLLTESSYESVTAASATKKSNG
jgi:hypothetical protein